MKDHISAFYRVTSTFLFGLLSCTPVLADDIEALAKQAQNPVADLISVPFQNNINFDFGPYNRTQNVMNFEPVIPFHISENWLIITRTILPIIHQPKIAYPTGAVDGIGDLNPTVFLSPAKMNKVHWGIGPTFLFPTATNDVLGFGKWGVGPSAVILTMPGHWVIGAITNNIWSVAGDKDRRYVNEFMLQYFINYNFPKGWYLTSSPIITAEWMASQDNVWTVPFGGGFGRLFKVDKLPINISVQAFDNVWTPEIGPEWTLRVQVQFLFPENKKGA